MEFILYVEIDNNITKSGNVKEKNIIKKQIQGMPVLVRAILRREVRLTDFYSVGMAWSVADRRNSVAPQLGFH